MKSLLKHSEVCLTEIILSIKHTRNKCEGFSSLSMKNLLILDSHCKINNKKKLSKR